MPLSDEEAQTAAEATDVGRFIDDLGRELFKAARYDDLEAAFRAFLGANTAGTEIETRNHFYETRLPALVTNYVITQHLEQGEELPWEKSFSKFIVAANPALEGEESAESLKRYLACESIKGRPLEQLVDEIIATCRAFQDE